MLEGLIGGVVGLVDSFIYTDEERQRDETARSAANAAQEVARQQTERAKITAASQQKLLMIGGGIVGVIVLGFVLVKALED
jgi:heterodisulfide reductase subunit A-like polyferredoxin